MKRILLSLLMITALCWSCEEVVIEETTGNVIGIVADMTTGDPVPVVNLSLEPGGVSTVTGSDGSFSFKDLEEGSYTISLSKKGYKSDKSTVKVKAGIDSEANLLIERIPAVITVDREVLDFGDNASMNTLSFNIVNNNYVDLKYEIIENCPWILDADPKSGDLPFGKTGTIVLTIDRDALQAGVNETTVVVRTAGEGSSELLVRATGIDKRKASLNIQDATDVRSSSVRLNAEITDSGAPAYTERGFVYSENPMPDFDNTIAKVTASVTEEMSFSVKVDGLELGKTYYARAYAVNSVGEAFSSNQISFTTTSLPAAVEITDVSVDENNMNVLLYARITDDGDPKYYEKGFVYSTSNPNPTLSDTKVLVEGENSGNFETCITDLKFSTDYYFRAYVSNANGTSYSDPHHVNIEPSLPEVAFVDASVNQNDMSVTIKAQITADGNPKYSEFGVVYSNVNTLPTISDNVIVTEEESAHKFEAIITGIDYDCDYYIRAYVKNINGVGYSEAVKARVDSSMPVVVTHSPSDEDKTHGVVVLHGEITDEGKPKYTEVGFVYSDVYQMPTIYDAKIVVDDVSANGQFELRMTELDAKKVYYVRTYALSALGIAYGEVKKVYEKDWVELYEANIVVQKSDVGQASWSQARNMCESSRVEGFSDWRLPTVVELKAMHRNMDLIGGFKTHAVDPYYCGYWSSDYGERYWNGVEYVDCYWVVNFYRDNTYTAAESDDCWVRCVRTLTPATEE